MTPEFLQEALRCTAERANEFLIPISNTLCAYHICTRHRKAAFLAQIAVESGGLRWLEEIWGPTAEQKRYDPPGELAEHLGNKVKGDGYKYRGRGLIETTGLANYTALSKALKIDFVNNPDWLVKPEYAAKAAGFYWLSHGCNELADDDFFTEITHRINGGYNGAKQREQAWHRIKKLLGIT